jgi:hypothetical protein
MRKPGGKIVIDAAWVRREMLSSHLAKRSNRVCDDIEEQGAVHCVLLHGTRKGAMNRRRRCHSMRLAPRKNVP